MQQSMLGWMRAGLLSTIGLALGCGGGDTGVPTDRFPVQVQVQLPTLPMPVAALDVLATLNGQLPLNTQLLLLPAPVTSNTAFLLQLPQGSQGSLNVEVFALPAAQGCVAADGLGSLLLPASPTPISQLPVGMQQTAAGKVTLCPVTLESNGPGMVTIDHVLYDGASSVAKRTSCVPGRVCRVMSLQGQPITLYSYPDTAGKSAQWSGACSGTAMTCSITVSGRHQAAIRF